MREYHQTTALVMLTKQNSFDERISPDYRIGYVGNSTLTVRGP